jgi:hypothetical protein
VNCAEEENRRKKRKKEIYRETEKEIAKGPNGLKQWSLSLSEHIYSVYVCVSPSPYIHTVGS